MSFLKVIGNPPRIFRWHIAKNRFFNIYLHKFVRDDDRSLHDHHWWCISIILSQGYIERTPKGAKTMRAGSVVFRRAQDLHRIELIDNKPCWTLFVTGPKLREWGFQTKNGWIQWEDVNDPVLLELEERDR